jgi:predicted transcriptional regulator
MRYGIANELMKNYGWTQVEVSDKLRITQAAVSKYMGGKLDEKAKEFAGTSEIRSAARKIAKEIADGRVRPSDSIAELCFVCTTLRKKGKLCKMHLYMKRMDKCACDICLER